LCFLALSGTRDVLAITVGGNLKKDLNNPNSNTLSLFPAHPNF
jgi:hypothetical protein